MVTVQVINPIINNTSYYLIDPLDAVLDKISENSLIACSFGSKIEKTKAYSSDNIGSYKMAKTDQSSSYSKSIGMDYKDTVDLPVEGCKPQQIDSCFNLFFSGEESNVSALSLSGIGETEEVVSDQVSVINTIDRGNYESTEMVAGKVKILKGIPENIHHILKAVYLPKEIPHLENAMGEELHNANNGFTKSNSIIKKILTIRDVMLKIRERSFS